MFATHITYICVSVCDRCMFCNKTNWNSLPSESVFIELGVKKSRKLNMMPATCWNSCQSKGEFSQKLRLWHVIQDCDVFSYFLFFFTSLSSSGSCSVFLQAVFLFPGGKCELFGEKKLQQSRVCHK